jgi:hypothetical protein
MFCRLVAALGSADRCEYRYTEYSRVRVAGTLEHSLFKLNRKRSSSLFESVTHASSAIPPEAITL